MTIKKQFIFLSLFLILIPVSCALLIKIQIITKKGRQYLIPGSNKIEAYESDNLNKEDLRKLFQTLRLLPPDVQCLLFSRDTNEILYCNFPEFTENQKTQMKLIWEDMSQTSDKYFYQFTTSILENKKGILITRIPKKKHKPERKNNMFNTFMIFLSVFVIICIILIIFISKTIFTSIIKIENKTQQLSEGKLSEKITVESDITKKNEITSILISLEKMRQSIIDIINKKNKFLMGISHDLRTPVAIIKGYSEAITDKVIHEPTEIIQSITLIEREATHLSDMINTLINYMKLSENEIREKLTLEPISIIIKDFANTSILSGNVFKREITSNINLSDNILVPLNKQLIIRSFENIFSNALRYTRDNDKIEINSFQNDNKIILEIKDTGIGIDKNDIPNIFDMFYRGTNSRLEEGMGIGLSVVKNIIDMHGWNITVNSIKNVETCFTIIIPINKKLKD